MNQTQTPRPHTVAPAPAAQVNPFRVQIKRLQGEFGQIDAIDLHFKLRDDLQGGRVHIILNFEKVTYLHPAGVLLICHQANRMREYGGDVKIVAADPTVRNIFRLCLEGRLLDFCMTEEEALENFKNAKM